MKSLIGILIGLSFLTAEARQVGPYPDSTDVPVILQQAFKRLIGKELTNLSSVPVKCKALSFENKTALADFDVLTGFPYSTTISPAFWTWYYDCIDIYSKNILFNSDENFKAALGSIGAKHFENESLSSLKSILWQSVPLDVRTAISKSVIQTLIREDLILEFGGKPEAVVAEIEKTLNDPARSEFKVDQALMIILQTVFKQKYFILE